MNLDEIKKLLALITETDVTEFEIEQGDEKIRIRRGPEAERNPFPQPPYVVVAPSLPGGAATAVEPPAASNPAAPQAASSGSGEEPAAVEAEEEEGLVLVTAPIVGTFYEAPSPEAPPFVEVGDRVSAGKVLCIIEAMKLMNEIEAEMAGVIVKRFVATAQPVEYGEALFALRPD